VRQAHLKACAAIAASAPRLACYDELAGRPAAPTEAPAAVLAPPPVPRRPCNPSAFMPPSTPPPATGTSLSAKVLALARAQTVILRCARGRAAVGTRWPGRAPGRRGRGHHYGVLHSRLSDDDPQGRTTRVRRLR